MKWSIWKWSQHFKMVCVTLKSGLCLLVVQQQQGVLHVQTLWWPAPGYLKSWYWNCIGLSPCNKSLITQWHSANYIHILTCITNTQVYTRFECVSSSAIINATHYSPFRNEIPVVNVQMSWIKNKKVWNIHHTKFHNTMKFDEDLHICIINFNTKSNIHIKSKISICFWSSSQDQLTWLNPNYLVSDRDLCLMTISRLKI